MSQDLGIITENCRISRGISVKDLCEGIISKSSYSRFIHGHTMLSIDTFLQIIDRMSISLAMFLQEYLNFFELKHQYNLLHHGQVYKNREIILSLINELNKKTTKNVNEENLLCLCHLLLKQSGEVSSSKEFLIIKEYLERKNFWGEYDYKLIKNSQDYFDLEWLASYLTRMTEKLSNLNDPLLFEEYFFVVGDIYTRALMEGEIELAQKFYEILPQLFREKFDIAKRLFMNFYQGLAMLIFEKECQGYELIETAVQTFADLEMKDRVDKFSSIYAIIQERQSLPQLFWIEEDGV